MDPLTLVITILTGTEKLLQKFEEVQECHGEAMRLRVRLEALVFTIRDATDSFKDNDFLQARLVTLNNFIHELEPILEQCKKPAGPLRTALHMQRVSHLAKTIRKKESDLQALCDDLGLAIGPALARKIDAVQKAVDDMKGTPQDGGSGMSEEMKEILRKHNAETKEILRLTLDDTQRSRNSSNRPGLPGRLQGKVCHQELLRTKTVLGEGSFGQVHAGTYFDEDVAIKSVEVGSLPQHIQQEFRREAELHFALRHPNIVEVFGYSVANPVCMIMERMWKSLHDCIRSRVAMDTSKKMILLIGATEGLKYLHALGISHMEVKGTNVLVDARLGVAKLSDFGLARVNSSIRLSTGKGFKNVNHEAWMAPEMLGPDPEPRPSCDMFSLSIIIYEVMMREIVETKKTLRLSRVECVGELQSIVDECLSLDPSKRPRALAVKKRLQNVESQVRAGTASRSGCAIW